ncbi:hypothetical protein AB0C27_03855 [Nonomuraea sp. NPDC048882]|uniref:hypothetical protein n=1 Tax=Nonomuraea sp. NPDC048882 TaxID=3154347 RepID=UPI0033F9E0D3
MQDPTEADRQEILTGPGDTRLENRASGNRRPRQKSNKTLLIAGSALIAVLVAGGAGYMLASNPFGSAQQGGGPATSQSADANQDQGGDDDATAGDVTADSPADSPGDDRTGEAPEDDGSMGDVAAGVPDGGDQPGTGDRAGDTTGNTGTDSAKTGTNKKPATTSPTKSPQSSGAGTPSEADSPADGPGGLVPGQCSKSGC